MLLEVKDIKVGYGKKEVVHGISLQIDKGEVVTLIGHNGAGKTTTLKGIIGVLKPTGGDVVYSGSTIRGRSITANVKNGITYIPQERMVFGDLSVQENLELGSYTISNKSQVKASLDMVQKLFPVLAERRLQKAKTLSGGEQRMLSLGTGMMSHPMLLLLDEPSLGLSPLMVGLVMDTVKNIQQTFGTAVIIIEQNVRQALRIAQRVYVMKMGRIILEEKADEFSKRGSWWDLF